MSYSNSRQRKWRKNDVVIDIPENGNQACDGPVFMKWYHDCNDNADDRKSVHVDFDASTKQKSDKKEKEIAEFKKERSDSQKEVGFKKTSNAKKESEMYVADSFDLERDIYQLVLDGEQREVVRYLEKHSNEINIPNQEGYYLIHLAILNSYPPIFYDLVRLGADLNVTDPDGKTPLHHVIVAESPEMLFALLSRNVASTVADSSGMMPLHMAAEVGSVKIMTMLLPSQKNLSIKGEGGMTPIHFAAINNQGAVITLLMEKGASPMLRDEHGNYPIHCAAKNAANSAIEAIVDGADELKLQKSDLISVLDREKNMPIHCAVVSANIQTVKVCMKAGSSINSQQADGSTPVHLVAAQGLLEMAKVMNDYLPDPFLKAIKSYDHLKRTPLHWATVFNHLDMVVFLLEKGARINGVDIDGNTPLLIAAQKGSVSTVKTLLSSGAEPHVKDRKRRTFLHLLVLAMESVPDLIEMMKTIKHYQKIIKSKDIFGYSPLHYATKCGHLTMFNDLLKLGSSLSLKSNKKQTILHLGAQFGRYNTCEKVINKRSNLQNEPDELGMTPLHLAALCGQLRIVTLLLDKGVSAGKDNKNNTPLHLAASMGRVDCMKTLLATHRNLLNLTNSDGNTALHMAARAGYTGAVVLLLSEGAIFLRNNNNCSFYDEVIECRHEEVALSIIQHKRWNEVFQFMSATNGTFMLGLIKKLPDICLIVLDRCVTESEEDPSSENYFVEYNFSYLNLPENFPLFANYNKIHYVPLLPLEQMVINNRGELLSHPLCINFLRMKWRKYGVHLHFFETGMYFCYLFALTVFVLDHDPFDHYEEPGVKLEWRSQLVAHSNNFPNFVIAAAAAAAAAAATTTTGKVINTTETVVTFQEDQSLGDFENQKFIFDTTEARNIISLWFICAYSSGNLIKMCIMFLIMRLRYLSYNLLLDLSVYLTAAIFAIPYLDGTSTHLQWDCGAMCIFLSWFNCLVNLQRFDMFGIYVVMFMEILKTLIQVVLIFSLLNVAFGLAFYVLMLHEGPKGFSSPILAMYRTIIMMFELDYMAGFSDPLQDGNELSIHFPYITYLLLMIFILLMPILLINLMIGLAVGDIEAVQREARLKRVATQVSFHSGAETKLPYLRTLTDEKVLIHPNKPINVYMNAYNKLMGMSQVQIRDPVSGEDNATKREIEKTNQRLEAIDVKLDKNIALMNQVMKRLHMNTEEEMWDEGSTLVEGIGEIEETKAAKKAKDSKSK